MPQLAAALASEAAAMQLLTGFALIWLRVAPAALLVPSLGLGAPVGMLSWLLSFAAALALWPSFVLLAPAEPLLGTQLMAAVIGELARGLALGLGCALPLWVFSTSGTLTDALRSALPSGSSPSGTPLATLYGGAALVAVWGLAFQAGFGRLLFAALLDAPLTWPSATFELSRALLLDSAWLVLRAFGLGIVLSAPMLLASFAIALVFGLLSVLGVRAASSLAGTGLFSYLGLAAACLTALGLLERAPQVAQLFLRETGRLLGRLH